MALTFGGATSDRVAVTAAAGINNLAAITIIAWVNITTLTNLRMIASKDNGSAAAIFFALNGTGGNVQLQVARTVNAYASRNDTPLSATSVWKCIAGVWALGSIPVIYVGSLATALVDGTYSTQTAGSGTQADDSAYNFLWANDGTTLALQGRIAHAAVFGATLSLADCQSWQRRPRKTVGANVAKFFHRLGNEGTGTQQDYSGNSNTGAVTGATQSAGPALDEGENQCTVGLMAGLLVGA